MLCVGPAFQVAPLVGGDFGLCDRAHPDAKLEWIDGAEIDGAWVEGWAVVDDEKEIVRPLLLEDRQHRQA